MRSEADGHAPNAVWTGRLLPDHLVIDVTAFFDTGLFDEMWTRVSPR